MPRCNGSWFKRHNFIPWKETGESGSIMSRGPMILQMQVEDPDELEWYRVGGWFVQERTCKDCGYVQREVQKVKS